MSQTGIIFDIQRTALHDGPGIRTTVFFKGCPLACLWCHNPESVSYQPQVSFNPERCVLCAACMAACQRGAHQVSETDHDMDRDLCLACGDCIASCNHGALKMVGETWTAAAVMAEVECDLDYYTHSGGGITLSGGEPMAQFDFAVAILTACRARGIHTCIETSGYAPQDRFREILPLVDLFLFDYKVTEPGAHRDLVGVPNDLVLANLDFLYRQGAAIILRCPLVPGINDTPAHLAGIAKLAAKYSRLQGIELMPYHDLGVDKGRRLGQEPRLEVETPSQAAQDSWLEILASLGCEVAVIG